MEIKKVLIANRGEIALRIMRTLRQMRIASVALYTDIEVDDHHVRFADQSFSLGNGTLAETWLNIALIVRIARDNGIDAIHPGYGFLSENASFAKACEDEGIIFIGPSSEVIEHMGSKIKASAFAREAGIPLLPRLEGSPSELLAKGSQMGFPLLVKASAGGGGKGMIRIDSAEMLQQAVFSAAEQAQRYFADEKVYLEKYIKSPRHIEVQIVADHYGNVVHLFERECTLQRNHQKVVEEAPSATLSTQSREALCDAAVSLAKSVGYTSAGTVEFILDENGKFYFLEMNTRIQVEHPVSELITGVDIVKEQIRIAKGEKLSFSQNQLSINGHAVEVRLYAEDPANNYRPSAGVISKIVFPSSKSVRIDSGIEDHGKVHPSFDAMISKIITWAPTRHAAIDEMKNALGRTMVHGITTNINLLSNIVKDEIYISNQIHTHTIAENLERWALREENPDDCALATALFFWLERFGKQIGGVAWRMAGNENILVNKKEYSAFYHPKGDNGIMLSISERIYCLEDILTDGNKLTFTWNKKTYFVVFNFNERNAMFLIDGIHYEVLLPQPAVLPKVTSTINGSKVPNIKASLFGRVLRVNVSEKQKVKSGDSLMVIESMKMENAIIAPDDNIISAINVKEGDQVSDGQVLIAFQS
jgi:acetyl/propionyl-CoA carboxylase alpha subunit